MKVLALAVVACLFALAASEPVQPSAAENKPLPALETRCHGDSCKPDSSEESEECPPLVDIPPLIPVEPCEPETEETEESCESESSEETEESCEDSKPEPPSVESCERPSPDSCDCVAKDCPCDWDVHKLLPHPTEKDWYCRCNFDHAIPMPCAPGTVFNPKKEVCVHAKRR